MDFRLSEEQCALRDTARRFVEARWSAPMMPSRGEALNDLEPGSWEASALLGWGGLALPERLGGSGQSLANALIVAIEVGRRASPLPLAPTILAGLAVAPPSADDQSEVVAAAAETIAEGTAVVVWADAELGAEATPCRHMQSARATAGT